MKHYKIKPPKAKVLKPFWLALAEIENTYHGKVWDLEKLMEKETGIKGIEFFRSDLDGSICGIGNDDRTLRLIHRTIY